MTAAGRTLEIRSSPHVLGGNSVDHIMRHVLLALLPTAAFAVYAFGLCALATLLCGTAAAVLTEHLLCVGNKKETTVGDGSAVITGLLLALTLPPGLPLWMVALGSAIAIVLGKAVFGGLGYNPFNPALVGRAVLQAAFPVAMTTWPLALGDNRFGALPGSLLTLPLMTPVYDGTSSATPLSAWKFGQQPTAAADLLLGFTGGSLGETCAVLIALGGVYLASRRMLNWRIPVAILATVALLTAGLQLLDPARFAGPLFHLGSGGLMLGAVFMATDMVGAPLTHRGAVVYGAVIGVLVVVIRVFGAMPEGVMYAILLGNALVPHIDRWLQPRVYGTRRRKVTA